MPSIDNPAAAQEFKYLQACLFELSEADRLRDEVRRFYAADEVAGIASNSDVASIAAEAKAALAASHAKATRFNRRRSAAARLKAAASSHCLPPCSVMSINEEGDLLVYEF